MISADLRTLCVALGFTTVVLKDGEKQPDSARRAVDFANMIEAFCLHVIPQPDMAANENSISRIDTTIDRIKSALRLHGSVDMNRPRQSLFELYDRLRERYATYATDDMVADRVLGLIDAEIERDSGES